MSQVHITSIKTDHTISLAKVILWYGTFAAGVVLRRYDTSHIMTRSICHTYVALQHSVCRSTCIRTYIFNLSNLQSVAPYAQLRQFENNTKGAREKSFLGTVMFLLRMRKFNFARREIVKRQQHTNKCSLSILWEFNFNLAHVNEGLLVYLLYEQVN